MPEITNPPTDGTEGEAPREPTPEPKAPEAGKTFTQAQLDAILAERLARAKPDDYEEAKAALEEKRRREEGEKTELQKAAEREAERVKERDEARAETIKTKRDAAIQIEALQQGADLELVILALTNNSSIKVSKDGQVEGAKEAVAELLERKPNLKVGGPTKNGAEFGGSDPTTVSERIAALEREGTRDSIAKARDLKIAQMAGMTVSNT